MTLTRQEIKKLQDFMRDTLVMEVRKPNLEQINEAKEWLADAKKEFKAYKVLKRNNLTPQMVEHLSLCVEKTVKSFGFLYGSVNSQSVKSDIGHISPRVFIRILDNTNTTEFMQKNFPQYQKMNLDVKLDNIRVALFSRKKVQSIEKEFMQVPGKHIEFMFEVIDKVSEKIKEELNKKTVEDLYETSSSAKRVLSPVMPIVQKTKEWKQLKKIKPYLIWKMPSLYMNLFLLSFILFPFYNVSRYNMSYGIKFETGLGVVDTIMLLEDRTNLCVKSVEKEINRLSK